jgi:hypothetical protein
MMTKGLKNTGVKTLTIALLSSFLMQSCGNIQTIAKTSKAKQKKEQREFRIQNNVTSTSALQGAKAVNIELNTASEWQSFSSPTPQYKWDRKLRKAVSAKTLAKRNKQYKVLEPSCKTKADYKDFEHHTRTYTFDASLQQVWNAYSSITPDKAWKGPLNNYEKSYSRQEDVVFIPQNEIQPEIAEGMIYFLRLRIAKVMNVHVSFEITKLSKEQGIIEFTYMRNNKSHGRQVLQFSEQNGKTILVHTSRFYSGKKIRDKFLYAPFHERCIDEFHANVKQLIKKDCNVEPLIAVNEF